MFEEECWQALINRNSNSDGTFVYGVRSTGIYCRPSCPSRLPSRKMVSYFNLPEEAEQAGFRACKRCEPSLKDRINVSTELVKKICQYIENNLEGNTSLADLSEELHLSPYHLQRTFKKFTGISPRQYTEACRLNLFKTYLREGEDVTKALYEAGYGSSSSLYERFPAYSGMTPSLYRKGGVGIEIDYSILDCELGKLLVAATQKGISMVCMGNNEAEVQKLLEAEFPGAVKTRLYGTTRLQQWIEPILRFLEGTQITLDLPLDIKATAFQGRVWEMLRAIPYGSTRSYAGVARDIGQPKAIRAVARACAANPAALIIPCHRVLREDGALGGYRWGLERKRQLLEQEAKAVSVT